MVNATTLERPTRARRGATAPGDRPKRPSSYKPREGAAPRWPDTPYRWSYLQARMVEKDLQPKGLAEALGVDVNRVYEWLNGTQIPRPANLRKIARALELALPRLLESLPIQE